MQQREEPGDNPPKSGIRGDGAPYANALDQLSKKGATTLARRLERYWHEHG